MTEDLTEASLARAIEKIRASGIQVFLTEEEAREAAGRIVERIQINAGIRLSGASYDLTAFHTDPIMDEGRHSHTWKLTAWRLADPWFDQRTLREAIRAVSATWLDGEDLRPEYWAAEAMADELLTLANVVRVTVDRDGFCIDFSRP